MGFRLTFQLRFESDYHVGAGHRLGTEGDSALLRDGDRQPVLRGSTLRPLLREALRQLLGLAAMEPHGRRCAASGMAGDNAAAYCTRKPCPACRMFGTPAQAGAWRITSARPVGAGRPAAPTLEAVPAGDAQLAFRVRVNPRERRAEPRKLFSREEGDGRLVFEFSIESREDDAEALKQAALLVAASRMVRELGAGRRRGRGRCRIELVSATDSTGEPIEIGGDGATPLTHRWLAEFERLWLKTPPDSASARVRAASHTVPRLGTPGLLKRYRIVLRAEEPVVVARRAEAANEFESLLHIPGGVLLGALAARVAARYRLTPETPEAYAVFAALFRHGRVRFPVLYPCLVEEVAGKGHLFPAIPAALVLLTCALKPGYPDDDGHGVWFVGERNDCEKCGGKPKDLKGDFIALRQPQRLVQMHRRVEMHNRINPFTGRVAARDLFAYQAIEAGQFFVGEIECDELTWQALRTMADLPPSGQAIELRLGKATGRGYGRVWLTTDEADGPPAWIRIPFETRCPPDAREITLTLLTDAILLDDWGRAFGDLWAWVRTELQLSRQALMRPPASGQCSVDGFNAHLGLPRWRDTAIAAGSTVAFRVPDGAAGEAIRERVRHWEVNGIGLRRMEGFGRVAVNHPIFTPGGFSEAPALIAVPPVLLWTASAADDPVGVETRFRIKWGRTLAETDSAVLFNPRNGPFCAVARLIGAEAPNGGPAVRARLDEKRLGQPGVLVSDTAALAVWEKEKPFDSPEGRKGMGQIHAWLDALEQHVRQYPSDHANGLRTIGLRMLAETIADAACGKTTEAK